MTQQSAQTTGHDTGASNIVYDLVSIQYHALKGAQVYDQYLADATQSGIADIQQFIEQVKQQDRERAITVHKLLAQHTQLSGGMIDLTGQTGGQAGAAQGSQQMASTAAQS